MAPQTHGEGRHAENQNRSLSAQDDLDACETESRKDKPPKWKPKEKRGRQSREVETRKKTGDTAHTAAKDACVERVELDEPG